MSPATSHSSRSASSATRPSSSCSSISEGRIQHVNPFFERLTGYQLDELRGKDWFDTALPERERERRRAMFFRSLDGGRVRGEVRPITTRAGEERSIEWTDEITRGDDGEPVGVLVFGQDVTDWVRAETHLQQAQAMARVGSWERDLVHNTTWWSDEMFEIVGLDATTTGPSFEAFLAEVHPDDRAALLSAFESGRASGEGYDLEHRLLRPDGRVSHIRSRVRFVLDAQRRPRRSQGTLMDVTAEVQAELRLRNILDSMFVFVVVTDLEGNVVEVNKTPLAVAGLQREDVLGKPFAEAYWLGDSEEEQRKFRVVHARAAQGEVIRQEFRARIGESAFAVFDSVFGPLRDASGAIVAVVGLGVDVTARAAAEAAARESEVLVAESEQRLATVFHHASDAMLLLAVEEGGTLRVAAANRSFVDRLRRVKPVEERDLVGLTMEELSLNVYERPPEVLAEYLASLRQVIDTRAPLGFEHQMQFPNGLVFAEVSLVPVLDEAGACIYVLWSSRDVTARKQTDAQIRAPLAEKETLLREIHHRVKNNLQIIASLLHFHAKRLRAPEDVAAFTELRQRIFAMTLVHERLYQSRDVARVDFAEYVSALVAELRRSIQPRAGIELRVVADDVALPIETALPSGMIVCELVTNVLKYAFPLPRDGAATVSIRRRDGQIVIGVDDNGVGLPPGFDPAAGASFGWALVRMLVAQLEGTVVATSGDGAHVRVSFADPARGGALPS